MLKKILNFIKCSTKILYSKRISKLIGCDGVKWSYPINKIIGSTHITIGKETHFGKYAVITAWDSQNDIKYSPVIQIGNNCNFGDFLHMTAINKIIIGNWVLTGRWVTISDNSHGTTEIEVLKIPPIRRKWYSKGPIYIGNNVWIGDKVTILAGVTIGEGVVIGANSVVTKDIPAYSIVAGNPARILKYKNNE